MADKTREVIVVPDELREQHREPRNRPTGDIVSRLVEGQTLFLPDAEAGPMRGNLNRTLSKRGLRLVTRTIEHEGRAGILLWAEPKDDPRG